MLERTVAIRKIMENLLPMATNIRTWLLATACATTLCAPLQSQTDASATAAKQTKSSAKSEKKSVTRLDGTRLFGFIEVTDDYTIRITNDSGITRVPISQLGDADFQQYGFQKDRSKDGRFWYERKEALQSSEEDSKSAGDQKSGERSPVEIRLGEISAFQPFIAAYEKTFASKSSEKSVAQSKPEEKSDKSDAPFRPMFSDPGLGGPLPQPLSGLGSSVIEPVSAIQPAVSGGGQVIQSATGAAGLASPP
jgi:hypothetical protein